jgi:glycosyltransferase involved in cell wall biosynthesis
LAGLIVVADPLVSVLMLTRNHAPYLAQAINSVRRQSCSRWQLLIGEDASTDATAAIAQAAAAEDPRRIRIFSSPGGALGFHRNFQRLLQAAATPYVAFLEGDDWWCNSSKLTLQLDLLQAFPELSFCGGRTRVLDERDDHGADLAPATIGPAPGVQRLGFEALIANYGFHFSSVVMRRELVELPAWIHQQYCLDRPLYLLAAAHGDAGVVDAELSVYRLHGGGIWAPLTPLQKARRSSSLFAAFCRHFPRRFRYRFRTTLSHIHWSYLAEALRRRQRRQALAILWLGVAAAPRLRLLEQPRLSVGVLRRLVWPDHGRS